MSERPISVGWSHEELNHRPFLLLYQNMVLRAPKNATLVEVGVFRGRSLVELARCKAHYNRPDLRLVGIDDWSDRAYPPHEKYNPAANARELAEAFLKGRNALQYVELIDSDSAAAAALFEDQSLWFVYLDGGHSYDTVLQDILAWAPKIMPGGHLAGDDLDHKYFPDVRRAVEALFGEEGGQWRRSRPLPWPGHIKHYWKVGFPE